MGVKLVSASGGSVEIVAPATATNYTATMPANTGTVITTASTFAGTGPAFSAVPNATQTLANVTWTKLTFNTKEFDTASCYDNVTNYRFTPNVAGYYQINGGTNINGTTGQYVTTIYKNGSEIKRGNQIAANASGGNVVPVVSAIVYMNGSTDYVELYGYQGSGSSQTLANPLSVSSYFQAALVRAA